LFLELFRYAIVLLGTLISTYTDVKTGLILDKITYPMIALGVLFTIYDLYSTAAFFQLVVPAGVFVLGYALYYFGKLGGGDVKLFTGMALLLPYYQNQPFVLNVLLVAALTSVVAISSYYLVKYFRVGIKMKENRSSLIKSFALGILLLMYFVFLYLLGFIRVFAAVSLFIPMFFALLFLAFENGIKKNFFLKHISLKELEEDEIIAKEFIDQAVLSEAGLSFKGVISVEDAKKLVKLGLKELPVYRSLPPFAPFILLGVIFSFFWPDFFSLVFFPF